MIRFCRLVMIFVTTLLISVLVLSSCNDQNNSAKNPDKNQCDHIAGASKSENIISVSCTTDESYDLVTYCSKCNEEINRSKIITKYAYGHTNSQPIQQYSDSKKQYEYITYCTDCNVELKKEPFTYNIGLEFKIDLSGQSYHVNNYSGKDKHIVIPEYYNGKPVTCICDDAFRNYSGLKSITIPESVINIDQSAFHNCPIPTAIVPASMARSISNFHLETVFITSGTSILSDSFSNCKNLASVTISDSVTSIDSYAFYDCDSLTSIVIPDSVKSIRASAFSCCSNLANVTIGSDLTSIDSSAFANCPIETATIPTLCINVIPKTHLKTLTINGGESIGNDYAGFRDCENLTSVTIGDSIKNIGSQAFYSCSNLSSIIIGSNVTKMGTSVFESCPNLTSITVSDNNNAYKSIDGNLYSKDGKNLIQYSVGKSNEFFAIPTGVTSIGDAAFYNCSNLKSITIADSVTSIGHFAFYRCLNLTSIIIPNSVKRIDASFWGCSKLTSVLFENSNGWWYASSSNATSGTSISADSLSNPSTAATYLTSTYRDYFWKRG